MPLDEKSIRDRIEYVARTEMHLSESIASEVAFHMTDWLNELEEFHNFCHSPGALSSEELSGLLTNFLVHVPSHVAAAGKLYTGSPVTDVFKVGAVAQRGKQ